MQYVSKTYFVHEHPTTNFKAAPFYEILEYK